MTKRLLKAVGVMLFLLFVGGTILLPAFHTLHCAENHAIHEGGDCPICQVAGTPAITAPSAVSPIAVSVGSDTVVLQISIVLAPSLRSPTHARAPPAC